MLVLGIDPGSKTTGFGIVNEKNTCIMYENFKLLYKESFEDKLNVLHKKVIEIITAFHPTEIAIEKAFVNVNVTTALKLGEIRGALICGIRNYKLPIYEYTSTTVKYSLTGYGRATKEQVKHIVENTLHTKINGKGKDATDALAIALCHIHHKKT
jgi:crossover junction endodeoxyribonuclease RuvC